MMVPKRIPKTLETFLKKKVKQLSNINLLCCKFIYLFIFINTTKIYQFKQIFITLRYALAIKIYADRSYTKSI